MPDSSAYMEREPERVNQHLTLREWEVWHTYATYFQHPVSDLHSAARALVKAGAALCSVHQDGTAHWLGSDGKLQQGTVQVRLRAHHQGATLRFDPAPEEPAGSFIPEALFWAGQLRFEELRHSGDHTWMPPYVRLFLGRCDLLGSDAEMTCYPMVKLYQSGVVLVELRFIGPNRPVHIEEFIRRDVNLHLQRFELLRIPPGLGRLMARIGTQQSREHWPFRRRRHLVRAHTVIDRAVSETAEIHDDNDFSFELVPMDRGKREDAYDTLETFALGVVDAIGYVLGGPRSDFAALLLGHRPILERGEFWTGRPHVHVVRHADQAETAQDNEARHKADFGWILGRTRYRSNPELGADYLGKNHRSFGDYGVYLNAAATLWVWARRGLKDQAKWADPNRGYLIYGNQVVVELLEYGYMLHRQLFERASGHGNPDQVLAARRDLLLLRQTMGQYSHFGEIRDLLGHGWEALGLPDLRDRIAEALAIREAETALREARTGERRNRLLAFVFGLVAVPPVAGDVVRPLWEYWGWWRPATDEAYQLLTVGIAVVVVATLIQMWEGWLRWRQGR